MHVQDLAARGHDNAFLRKAAASRGPYRPPHPSEGGPFAWRGDQRFDEAILLEAASRHPTVAGELAAYERRLGPHTLSPDASAALNKITQLPGPQPNPFRPAPTGFGRLWGPEGPTADHIASAADQLRTGHLVSAAREATRLVEVLRKYPFSQGHEEAWRKGSHLRQPWDRQAWGEPTKAERRSDTRFLVTQMGQELREAMALIQPPTGGETGRRLVAEFDRQAVALLKKRKNGGRDAVQFYREHVEHPPPRPAPGDQSPATDAVQLSLIVAPNGSAVRNAAASLGGSDAGEPRRQGDTQTGSEVGTVRRQLASTTGPEQVTHPRVVGR